MTSDMYFVYVQPCTVHLVYDALMSIGWGGQGWYPTPFDFVTRLNNIASVVITRKILEHAVWDTITLAWIVSENVWKSQTFCKTLSDTIPASVMVSQIAVSAGGGCGHRHRRHTETMIEKNALNVWRLPGTYMFVLHGASEP